jgi:hypothetical protein
MAHAWQSTQVKTPRNGFGGAMDQLLTRSDSFAVNRSGTLAAA